MSALFTAFRKIRYPPRLLSVRKIQANAAQNLDEKRKWVRSPFPDVDCPSNVSLPQYLRSNMGDWGHLPAFECGITSRRYTHNELFEMSTSFAKSLLASGFVKGDVIGIALKNVPEYASILFGIWEAGLIASPLNPDFTPAELGRQLRMCEAKGIITTLPILKHIRDSEATGLVSKLGSVILLGENSPGCESFFDLVQAGAGSDRSLNTGAKDTREDLSLLLYSSGTTGLPKGVGLTQFNLLSNLLQITHPEVVSRLPLANGVQERLIGVLPFYHSYGLASFLTAGVHDGAHTLCIPKFDAKTFPDFVRRHKPTCIHLVTPLINQIVSSDDYSADDLQFIEHVNVGAAPVGPALLSKLVAKIGRRFILREGYGLTELSSASHLLPPDLACPKLGSAGVPVSNTVTKIIDPVTGQTLDRNQPGEICIRGPQVMKGYYKNEEATRDAIDEEGWLHTGDIGYYDESGFLYIVDRIKELIKVKGFQVSPAELEDVLRLHSGVADVGVLGIPDTEFGQVPRAYVVPKHKGLKAEDVTDFLKAQLSWYKQLRGGVHFVESIPKSPSGKILRAELRKLYEQNP